MLDCDTALCPQMFASLQAQNVATTFKKMVNKRENLETLGGMSVASAEGETRPHLCRLCYLLAGYFCYFIYIS